MEYGSILEDVVFVIIIIGPIQTQQGQSQKILGQFNVLLISNAGVGIGDRPLCRIQCLPDQMVCGRHMHQGFIHIFCQ